MSGGGAGAEEDSDSYKLCKEFLRSFYVNSRKIKEISITDFDSLFKIANANYIMRSVAGCNSVQ